VIQPEAIPFISYPYEWSFSQLKDAALTTLAIQRKAVDSGMILKDASAYNIQFNQGRPVLIIHFFRAVYREGQPWVAYRQFCQHFPGSIGTDGVSIYRLSQLLRIYIDGIPLEPCFSILPPAPD